MGSVLSGQTKPRSIVGEVWSFTSTGTVPPNKAVTQEFRKFTSAMQEHFDYPLMLNVIAHPIQHSYLDDCLFVLSFS
jgi:hypothetical protein